MTTLKTREPLTSVQMVGMRPLKADRVTTALILAAGTGSRLRPLTLDAPKCLTEVGGKPILGRQIDSLREQGIENLVMVTGFQDDQIRHYLDSHASGMQVDYVFNPRYATTNNIYSLWLARHTLDGPFMLLESDLVFRTSMLDEMLQPDRIAVSNILPWMNGTTVELDATGTVTAFNMSDAGDSEPQYKTVNIYTLSARTWHATATRMDQYILSGRTNEYYEAVFAEMISDGTIHFEAAFFDEEKWCEIDTVDDLTTAETLFLPLPRFARKNQPITPLGANEPAGKRSLDQTPAAGLSTMSTDAVAAFSTPTR